jgi:transcriptional regulator with XRE-family HTH domain
MQSAPERGEVRQAFGETLVKLRREADLSQEQLAFEAGVDRRYMSGLERGLHSPSLETILKLLRALKVSFSTFAREYEATRKRIRRDKSPK